MDESDRDVVGVHAVLDHAHRLLDPQAFAETVSTYTRGLAIAGKVEELELVAHWLNGRVRVLEASNHAVTMASPTRG